MWDILTLSCKMEMICIYFCIWWQVQSNYMFKIHVQWFRPPILFNISMDWYSWLVLRFFFFFFSKGLYYSKNVHQIMKTGTPSKFNGHLFSQVWGPWCVNVWQPLLLHITYFIFWQRAVFFPVYFTEVRRSLKKFKEQPGIMNVLLLL